MMKHGYLVPLVTFCVALAAGCNGDNSSDVVDTGSGTDAAIDTGNGTDVPAGVDVPVGTDVPVAVDVPVVTDTGNSTPLNGCTTFTDLSAPGATRTITLSVPVFTPNCVTIAAGQSVTWNGDFTMHTLNPGVAPSRPATDSPSSAGNPITVTTSGTTVTVAFPAAGNYGYYCAIHQSLGMYGVIRVQ